MSNYTGGVKNRRTRVISRLEAQLNSGTKPEKVAAITKQTTGADLLPLSGKDRERIEKELTILKSRV